ncbi:hypothetical protein M9458_058210 [Cirrhinus mrigala]|uniref:L1 transposable element RRM domain-containing protein n=1 Tax=Cirrhinus mrigala TaxID=683832 RepID=A0ABD0MAG9_CIRMR
MPKPSKQSKADNPQGFIEDISDASDASASSDPMASREGSPPGFTQEALFKHISDIVSQEGRRTQKMLDDSLAKLESGLNAKVDNIIKRIDEIATVTASLVARQSEAETRISALEDDIAPLKVKLAEFEKLNTALSEKVTDLEGRSRRDNIRILNLKESVEGSDPIQFFESFIPKLLDLSVPTIAIDRAHRGSGALVAGRPRPVIVKIHRSRDVTTILSTARRRGQLSFEDQSIRIVPDISPIVRAARRAFNPICAELIKKDIRFQMIFPAVLVFKMNGVQKSFKDPKEAKKFLGR